MRMELPKDIMFISSLYKKAGKELYVVGGAVRDHIRGLAPKDYDLATDANPEETEAILASHFHVIGVGKSFGVMVAITPEFPDGVEIATFREDIGTGRRPDSVRFTTIETDVLRRDLTINALFYNIDKEEIVDLVGGIKDLEASIIRTVGIPEDRFNDDPLRRFRAVRFAGDLNGELAEDLYLSLKVNSDLSAVSSERIKDEFEKLLTRSKNIFKSFELLKDLSMLHQIFPGLSVDIDLVGSSILVTTALMLRGNLDPITDENQHDVRRLQKQLVKMRWLSDEIAIISYLVRLQKLTPDTAFELKKSERRCKVTKELVTDFLLKIGKDIKLINAFLNYEITTDPVSLEMMGFRGLPLGIELNRIETNLFKELLNEDEYDL